MTKLDCDGIGMTSERTRLRLLDRLGAKGITCQRVLETMRTVPRHLFVDEALAQRAYDDLALPIGFGQTISQPYIVARMTEALLQGESCARILEVGTGSGYQAAVLSQLVDEVVTVERLSALSQKAKNLLRQLRYRNISCYQGNGVFGLPGKAPYDGIIVTAATEVVPEHLFAQLKEGGRLVIPLGAPGEQQSLQLITKLGSSFPRFTLDLVRFVPLVDDEA